MKEITRPFKTSADEAAFRQFLALVPPDDRDFLIDAHNLDDTDPKRVEASRRAEEAIMRAITQR